MLKILTKNAIWGNFLVSSQSLQKILSQMEHLVGSRGGGVPLALGVIKSSKKVKIHKN